MEYLHEVKGRAYAAETGNITGRRIMPGARLKIS